MEWQTLENIEKHNRLPAACAQIKFVEKIVEVPQVIYEERIVEVPKIEYREIIKQARGGGRRYCMFRWFFNFTICDLA